MSPSPIVVFLEPSDLQLAVNFLDDFLVIKVSNSEMCQKVWQQASWLSAHYHLVLGVIRQEWKESSNYFSQFYHLPHETPQLVHISKGWLESTWTGKEALNAHLNEEKFTSVETRKSKLYEFLAFRLLGSVPEMTAGTEVWHQKWLNEWIELVEGAHFQSPIKERIESFKLKWYPLFQSSWSEFSLSNRALFVKEAIELKELWEGFHGSKR